MRIGQAQLSGRALAGSAAARGHRLAWQLAYAGGEPPLLLLPRPSYARGFPRAKAVVAVPNAVFDGWLEIDGARLAIEGWRGSQNHNWGSRHTDRYAWGQVAGFDGAPDVFLECSTARVRLGPLWTPWLTLVALRVEGRELALNSLLRAARARARIDGFKWTFDTRARDVRLRAHIEAPASAFVGLRYANPPGGRRSASTRSSRAASSCSRRPDAPRGASIRRTARRSRSWATSRRRGFRSSPDGPR